MRNFALNLTRIILSFLFVFGTIYAQNPAKYWIEFTDKDTNAYSINHPEKFLSQHAIAKREKYGIEITAEDFPVNQKYIEQILKLNASNRFLTKSKWMNGCSIYSEDSLFEDNVSQLSFVKKVEKTTRLDSAEIFVNDTNRLYTELQNPENGLKTPIAKDYSYGKSEYQIRLNNAQWLHRMGYTGRGMVMMVLDGGFENSDTIRHFKNLRKDERLLGVRNFVLPEENVFRSGSHGTMVLSCIAANIDGELIGTAPDVAVYLAKTEDGRSETKIEEDNWVAGIEWADSLGVDVLNSSLGYTKFDDSLQTRTIRDLTGKVSRASRAATIAARKGMIVCNSAGNEGSKAWHRIGCPADADDILSVGATYITGEPAEFSSYGPSADGRIKPDACATGAYTFIARPNGVTDYSFGTSFSSPLLSGMVADLWQAFPDKTNYEIMDAIRQSGSLYSAPDSVLGYGIPDFLKAYNILYDKDLKSPKITIDNFVASKASKFKIFVNIESKSEQILSFRFTSRINGDVMETYKKVKAKKQTLDFKFSKIGIPYDILEMEIGTDKGTRRFVIGIEEE